MANTPKISKSALSVPGATPKEDTSGGPDDWQAKDHADTLSRAADILSDPNKLKRAQKHMKQKKQSFKSVTDLINHRNAAFGPGQNPSGEQAADDSESMGS